jgi:hypothetical protein
MTTMTITIFDRSSNKKINSIPASTTIVCNGCFEVLLSYGDLACYAGAPEFYC